MLFCLPTRSQIQGQTRQRKIWTAIVTSVSTAHRWSRPSFRSRPPPSVDSPSPISLQALCHTLHSTEPVRSGSHNKLPSPGWLEQLTFIYLLTALKPTHRSQGASMTSSGKALALACRWVSSPCIHTSEDRAWASLFL